MILPVRLLKILLEVGDTPAQHEPGEDQVEVVRRKSPVILDVVNLELDVWRHPARLDWAQVNPNDLRSRVYVAHLNGPVSRAGPQVQNASGIGQRRQVMAVPQGEQRGSMLRLHAFRFQFIVGHEILACSVRVISAAILVWIVIDGLCQARGV